MVNPSASLWVKTLTDSLHRNLWTKQKTHLDHSLGVLSLRAYSQSLPADSDLFLITLDFIAPTDHDQSSPESKSMPVVANHRWSSPIWLETTGSYYKIPPRWPQRTLTWHNPGLLSPHCFQYCLPSLFCSQQFIKFWVPSGFSSPHNPSPEHAQVCYSSTPWSWNQDLS